MLKKLFYFIGKHKKTFIPLGILLLVVTLIAYDVDIAFAQDTDSSSDKSKPSFEKVVIEVASTVVKYMSMLIFIVLSFIGKLLDNSFIFKEELATMLRTIWLVVRNLTNVGFAIILLGAAFYIVIFGGGEGTVNVKSALPRFVLGLVLVNFSWLGCSIILDVSSVLTSTIFSIPQTVQTEEMKCFSMIPGEEERKPDDCYDIAYIDINPEKKDAKKGTAGSSSTSDTEKTGASTQGSSSTPPSSDGGNQGTTGSQGNSGNKKSQPGLFKEVDPRAKKGNEKPAERAIQVGDSIEVGYAKLKTQDFGASNAAMILAVNMGAIEHLTLASKNLKGKWSTLNINAIFSLFMIVMICVPLFALWIVLLARMVVLWLSMAFMPLAFLGLVIQGRITTALTEGMPDLVDQFIKNAFLPVYVAAPFSVGFLMLNAGLQMSYKTYQSYGGQTYVTINPTIAGIGDTEMILWYLAVAAIIWAGVFTALKGNAITENIVGGIQQTTQGWAKTAASSIKYAPLIPIYKPGAKEGDKKEMYSLGSLMALPGTFRREMEKRRTDKTQRLYDAAGFYRYERPEGEMVITDESIQRFKDALANNKTEIVKPFTALKQAITSNNPEDIKKELKNLYGANNESIFGSSYDKMTAADLRNLTTRIFNETGEAADKTAGETLMNRTDIDNLFEDVAGKKAKPSTPPPPKPIEGPIGATESEGNVTVNVGKTTSVISLQELNNNNTSQLTEVLEREKNNANKDDMKKIHDDILKLITDDKDKKVSGAITSAFSNKGFDFSEAEEE